MNLTVTPYRKYNKPETKQKILKWKVKKYANHNPLLRAQKKKKKIIVQNVIIATYHRYVRPVTRTEVNGSLTVAMRNDVSFVVLGSTIVDGHIDGLRCICLLSVMMSLPWWRALLLLLLLHVRVTVNLQQYI